MSTKFSFEVPLKHLEYFDPFQDYFLALSFLCEDAKYFDYIRDRALKGDTVYLDNSYNELKEPEKPHKLARLLRELGASKVISPDCDDWTIRELWDSYVELTELVGKDKVIAVIKSGPEYNRFLQGGCHDFAATYEQRESLPLHVIGKSRHFLGLLSPVEIIKFSPETCDTSMPIKLALNGVTIKDWSRRGCPHINTEKAFFDLELSKRELDLAGDNIVELKKLCIKKGKKDEKPNS